VIDRFLLLLMKRCHSQPKNGSVMVIKEGSESREFRAERHHIEQCFRSKSEKENSDLNCVGLPVKEKKVEKQIRGVAAARVSKSLGVPVAELTKFAGVKKTCIYHHMKALDEKENASLVVDPLVIKHGRPSMYPPEFISQFVKWMDNPETPTYKKTSSELRKVFIAMAKEQNIAVTQNTHALDQFIRRLYQSLGYSMRVPKLIEAKRCVIFDTLKLFYEDPVLRDTLSDKNLKPGLVFNADETQISLRAGGSLQVLGKGKDQPSVVADDRSTCHVTLFLIVSADGDVAYPAPVLYGQPDTFVHDPTLVKDVKLYKTCKGYMERETFHQIMIEFFIPYVKEQRKILGVPETERAVLTVDGHASRYDFRTFTVLQRNNIDFIILPAHSSHLTQPTDLRCHHIIKSSFHSCVNDDRHSAWIRNFVSPSEEKEPGKKPEPPKKRGRKSKKELELQAQAQQKDAVACVTEGVVGPLRKPNIVSYAEFERYIFLDALIRAIHQLKPDAIRSSWIQSHLFPFIPVPPCDEAKMRNLERQVNTMGILANRRQKKQTIPLTGLVNSRSNTTLLNFLRSKAEVKAREVNGSVTYKNSEYQDKTFPVEHDPEGDVGDFAVVETGKEGEVFLIGDSSAVFARAEEVDNLQKP